jgi:Aspartyl protease
MKKHLLLLFFLLTVLGAFAQDNTQIIKERIDLLFKNMAQKNLDEVSAYFAEDISYNGLKGVTLTKTILKGIAIQKDPITAYKIVKKELINDKFRLHIVIGNEEDNGYNFLIDKLGFFYEINLFKIKMAEESQALKLQNPQSFPFELDGNAVNFYPFLNTFKAKFLFDTGATNCSIDMAIAKKLNLKVVSKQSAEGASGKEYYEVVTIDSLKLGSLIIKNLNALVVDLSKFGLDGIIGNDLLKNYVTRIDYDQQAFTFYNHLNECPDKYEKSAEFKFLEGIAIPMLEIEIGLKSGETFKGNVLMDSGATPNFLLNSNIVSKENLLPKFTPKLVNSSRSLTADVSEEYLSTVQSITVLENYFLDVPIVISLAKKGINATPNLMGILGNGIMYRFNWLFDYRSKTIYYHKNKQFDVQFDYPLINFKIRKNNAKLYFDNIQPESSEANAGIKPGFEILKVNGLKAENFDKIQKILKTTNQTIKITYRNDLGKLEKWKVKTKKRLI